LPEFQADHSKAQIKAEYAYARGITGKGVSVGVLDTGINPTHPSFAGDGKLNPINITDRLQGNAPYRPGEVVSDGTPNYRLSGGGHGAT
jgi:subtilase-type serine protease